MAVLFFCGAEVEFDSAVDVPLLNLIWIAVEVPHGSVLEPLTLKQLWKFN